jgi:hypothetical protein
MTRLIHVPTQNPTQDEQPHAPHHHHHHCAILHWLLVSCWVSSPEVTVSPVHTLIVTVLHFQLQQPAAQNVSPAAIAAK